MARILVVDDEPQILRALTITLRARKYDVDTANCGRQALACAASRPPDLIVLDLGLPDIDGVEVIHGLRGWTTVPIIVLSGRTDSDEKVAALDAGADDYVTKPFGMDELLARLRAAFRRATGPADAPLISIGAAVVDLAARKVTVAAQRHGRGSPAGPPSSRTEAETGSTSASGSADIAPPAPDSPVTRDIRLTPTEWHLLELLIRNPGRLITHHQLLDEVWGPGGYPAENDYLRVYMARLRRKLEPDPSRPRHLITEPGIGYRFQP
jgi:two-component system, OmpR family, KDP operon response regulator KdpE